MWSLQILVNVQGSNTFLSGGGWVGGEILGFGGVEVSEKNLMQPLQQAKVLLVMQIWVLSYFFAVNLSEISEVS